MKDDSVRMPSEVDQHVGWFDRFASLVARYASRAWFFAACVLLVVLWAPSFLVLGNIDTWQLVINTATTIVTFLLVALLQNTQTRADSAIQQKLNAIAAYLVEPHEKTRAELRHAVGIENRESA
jgi:low affinity Fe/Cu permease